MNCTIWVCLAIGSYLLGAIPFGFLIARMRGVDIRKVGSGNILNTLDLGWYGQHQPASTIEQRILGVQVQMNKFRVRHIPKLPLPPPPEQEPDIHK